MKIDDHILRRVPRHRTTKEWRHQSAIFGRKFDEAHAAPPAPRQRCSKGDLKPTISRKIYARGDLDSLPIAGAVRRFTPLRGGRVLASAGQ